VYITKINYGSLKPWLHNFMSFSEVLLLQVFYVTNTRIKRETQNIIHCTQTVQWGHSKPTKCSSESQSNEW
jgi:hypothetical protein